MRLRTLEEHSGTRPGAHTPGRQGSNAITVRLLLRPIVDLCRHTRLGLKLREEAGGHDRGKPVQGTHACARDPGTQDPWETRLLLDSITLLRLDGFDPRMARS